MNEVVLPPIRRVLWRNSEVVGRVFPVSTHPMCAVLATANRLSRLRPSFCSNLLVNRASIFTVAPFSASVSVAT